MSTRRHIICTIPNAIFLIAFAAHSMPATGQNRSKNQLLPFPSDLSSAAKQATASGQPLVIMASLPGCPWCELLRRNYLIPMQGEGVLAYEFMVNERSRQLRDFKAQSISPAVLSAQLKINITPTVLFFGSDGQEIAPRIEGVASADFIGAIIDERLAAARKQVKASK